MKHALEEAQRAERRIREEKNEAWNPRWFKLAKDADLHELERDVGTAVWEWNGEYAAVSAERAAAAEATNPLESNAFDPWCYEETASRGGTRRAGRERRTPRADSWSEVERTPRATSEASMDI